MDTNNKRSPFHLVGFRSGWRPLLWGVLLGVLFLIGFSSISPENRERSTWLIAIAAVLWLLWLRRSIVRREKAIPSGHRGNLARSGLWRSNPALRFYLIYALLFPVMIIFRKDQDTLLLLLGSGSVVAGLLGAYHGNISLNLKGGRSLSAERSKSPKTFWIIFGLHIAIGALLAVIGLMKQAGN